jgi:N-acetylglucosamine kinase-like BadF-type ATPase
MNQALSASGLEKKRISGAGFGVAGYDWESERPATIQAIQGLGLTSPFEVVNDTILGLLAGAPRGWGIAVVSGTGCNCRGWDRSHKHEGRVVGRSTAAGEGAGSTELMSEVVKAVCHEWTRRGPQTELTPALIEYTGAKSLADLLEGYFEGRYDLSGSAAPLVFRVAEAGDPVAQGIIRWAGCELGEMINAVVRQLQFEKLDFDIVLVGSMFDGGGLLREPMRKTVSALAPHAEFLRLSVPPVVGGLLLGMDAAQVSIPTSVRQNLANQKGYSEG